MWRSSVRYRTDDVKRAAQNRCMLFVIGEINMSQLEQLELTAHRADIIKDVNDLIDKYRAIFEWDVPDIDENLTNRLIVNEVRQALDAIQQDLVEEA
jgi:hypothetical protein